LLLDSLLLSIHAKKNEWHLIEINNVIFCLFFVLSLRAYNFFYFCISLCSSSILLMKNIFSGVIMGNFFVSFNRSWQIFITSSNEIDKQYNIKDNENLYYLFIIRGQKKCWAYKMCDIYISTWMFKLWFFYIITQTYCRHTLSIY